MIYSFNRIVKESLPVLILSGIITIGAGLVLNSSEKMITAFPGIIIMMPAFINMVGGLMSVLASRLSSALHLGMIHPKLHKTKTLDRNIIAMIIISLISFTFLGIIGSILLTVLGLVNTNMVLFTFMVLVAGLLTTMILMAFTIVLSYYLFKKGDDPDNWVIPILTSVSDLIGVIIFISFVSLII